MRKQYQEGTAFTLAEVLFTLVIIGVIAALTIPLLIQDIQKQDLRTQWKAAYSLIGQANQKALINYVSYTGAFANATDMKDKLKDYFFYIKECAAGASDGNCWSSNVVSRLGNPSGWSDAPAIILNNGMFLRFAYRATDCTDTLYFTTGECGGYEVDVNGFRGPNMMGEDVFWIDVLPSRISPAGAPGSTGGMQSLNSTGTGALYLRQ